MRPAGRIFFDITFTRTQVGSVGITRTVRRLREELDKVLSESAHCIPVTFHSSGYRSAKSQERSSNRAPSSVSDSMAARLLRWVTESFARRLAFAILPLPILHWLWKLHSSWTFDALSKYEHPVAFKPGDRLLLCDASWCCKSWEAARRAREQGAEVVLLVYDLIPIRQPLFCSPLTTKIFGTWLKEMLPRCDAVICISKATELDLRAYASETRTSLPPTGHFRLGCDPARQFDARQVRSQILSFLGGNEPCFASVGSIEPRKNYGMLLAVFEQLWAHGEKVRLLIAGRPTADCHELVQKMRHHPEQGKKLMTLFDASDPEIGRIYADCRALVFPSLAEGFGLPLVEARTRGCMVIASDLPAFRELADEGVILFDQTSVQALRTAILHNIKHDFRPETQPMRPFLWQDSAKEFSEKIEMLIA